MRNYTLKADNLVKLLEGLSFLNNQDQERIISVIDALNFAEKKGKKAVFTDTPSLRLKMSSAYINDKSV